jgi:hypothetical protein
VVDESLHREVAEQAANLESLKQLCDGKFNAVEKQIVDMDKFFNTRLNEMELRLSQRIDTQSQTHNQLRDVIESVRREFTLALDQVRRVFGDYRDKNDIEIRTLREGRSSDKGRQLAWAPLATIATSVIGAVIAAALISTFINRPAAPPRQRPAATEVQP